MFKFLQVFWNGWRKLLELLYNKHQHEHHGGDQWRASFKPCSRPGDQ